MFYKLYIFLCKHNTTLTWIFGKHFKILSSSLPNHSQSWIDNEYDGLWKCSPNIQISDELFYKPIPITDIVTLIRGQSRSFNVCKWHNKEHTHDLLVKTLPEAGSSTINSCRYSPNPMTNDPSIWPISIHGFTVLPVSSIMSTLRTWNNNNKKYMYIRFTNFMFYKYMVCN